MIKSYLDSLKYSGYLYPIAVFRIYFGYLYILSATERLTGPYLERPILVTSITNWYPRSSAPVWFQDLLENLIIPNWKVFAYMTTYSELGIGLLLIVGFLVRPAMLLGALLTLCYIYASGDPSVELHQMNLIVCLVLFWIGAGRCLGIDYHFFKSRRGFWW